MRARNIYRPRINIYNFAHNYFIMFWLQFNNEAQQPVRGESELGDERQELHGQQGYVRAGLV